MARATIGPENLATILISRLKPHELRSLCEHVDTGAFEEITIYPLIEEDMLNNPDVYGIEELIQVNR